MGTAQCFYQIGRGAISGYFGAAPDPWPEDYLCFLRHGPQPGTVVRYDIDYGHKFGDVLSTAAWSTMLCEKLREHHATGIEYYPIEVTRKKKPVEGYVGIVVSGTGGPFDEVRSGADWHGRALFGHDAVFMDESQWDGSDVFTIPGLGMCIFVSQRIGEALKDTPLRNVKLVLNSECRFGTKDPAPPRRKAGSMPDDMASKQKRVPEPATHQVPAPVSWDRRFPPGFDFAGFSQEIAKAAAVQARVHEGMPLPDNESEVARFTATLFADLSENLVIQDRIFGRQPDFPRIKALMRSAPTLIEVLRCCMAERPVNAPRVIAAAYRLGRTVSDYIPAYSVAWSKLLAMGQGLINECRKQGYSEAEIERMIQEQMRNLPIPEELK